VAYLGTVLSSFPEAHHAMEQVLGQVLGIKRIERLTERIGWERVEERDARTETWEKLPLMRKIAAPPGVKPPQCVAVMSDGGRYQLCEENPDSGKHWHEYKAGALLEFEPREDDGDPCPELPSLFSNREHVETLTREIHQMPSPVEDPPAEIHAASDVARGKIVCEPPKLVSRDVVATARDSAAFGPLLVERAWALGMLSARLKAYVGDGQNWIWSLWERHFKPYGFVPILDLIHALTYVFAAANAGRSAAEGWTTYVRWMTWVWQGQITQVIADLAVRQQELGTPTESDGATSPRRVVTESLTYLQNQQSRMNYPDYRRQGLPITSSHMESTIKLLNHRVKGSEKFWSRSGAEALLQLKADTLSASEPLTAFWRNRPHRQTGFRTYARQAA
jgi:hypothetical protein